MNEKIKKKLPKCFNLYNKKASADTRHKVWVECFTLCQRIFANIWVVGVVVVVVVLCRDLAMQFLNMWQLQVPSSARAANLMRKELELWNIRNSTVKSWHKHKLFINSKDHNKWVRYLSTLTTIFTNSHKFYEHTYTHFYYGLYH